MKGLELSRKYFEEYGLPMLKEQFPDLLDKIAAGLMGSGSECYGFDDEISQDHDFEPGFCLFLADDADEKTAFKLERAYLKLPKEFQGYRRSPHNPVGGSRHGVFKIGEYFSRKVGSSDGYLTVQQWLTIPDHVLSEATNGEIFLDGSGLLTEIVKRLADMPEDIRLKKLAGHLLIMEQSGLYNYERCLKRSETAAAQLAVQEFVNSALKTVFLLNRKYLPFYKWQFRALRGLSRLSITAEIFEFLISTNNDESNSRVKKEMMDNVVMLLTEELQRQGLSAAEGSELERLAHGINNRIKDPGIRNLDILIAIQ